MIPHIVYFEALAGIGNEEAPKWKSTVAGLVTLRLIDDWLEYGVQVVTTDLSGLKAIREAIAEINPGDPIRTILNDTLDALLQADEARVKIVVPHLMAYGRALHYNGDWKLAKDVFDTLVHKAEVEGDTEIVIQASLRVGFVNRRMGEHEESEAAYMFAEEESRRIGFKEGIVRGQLGVAQLTIDRGNLPLADQLLEEVISNAKTLAVPAVMGDALQDRAHLHHTRGNFSEAIRYGYSALEFAPDALARDRILGNIAASFADLGHLQAAKDAHLIVVATTQEEWLKQQTLLNLMEIAIIERHETTFHSIRKTVADSTLQPIFQAYFHLYSAKGYRAFGNTVKAEVEFKKAIDIASKNSFNQLAHTAETERDKSTPVHAMESADSGQSWPEEITRIASAIGHLRELSYHTTTIGA